MMSSMGGWFGPNTSARAEGLVASPWSKVGYTASDEMCQRGEFLSSEGAEMGVPTEHVVS